MTTANVYVVAGSSGAAGYTGDGGHSTSAKMNTPVSVGLDASGDIFIADSGNNVIREALSQTALLAKSGPVLPNEMSGGSNPSELSSAQPSATAPGTAGTGLTANSVSGELDVNVTDDSIPGRGLPLDLTRTYSSGATNILGPFGYGWTDSYNMSITQDPVLGSSVMDVNQENGSVVVFEQNATGAWVPPNRVNATLVRNGGGTWTFSRADQHSYAFSSSGHLTAETDLNGFSTSLSYSGSNLTTVTEPGARTFGFSYGTNGLVSQVSAPGSQTISYGYDASKNLTSVTDVGTAVTYYGYDVNHRITSVKNAVGDSTTISYDNANQVLSMTDPLTHTTSWVWGQDVSESGTNAMMDPSGHVTKNVSANGELISQTEAFGTAVASTTTYQYASNTDAATATTTAAGGSNAETTTTSVNANGDTVQSANALGQATSTDYNALNQPVGSTSALGETTNNTYDSSGNLLSSSQPLPGGGSAVTTYSYGGTYAGDVMSKTDPDGNTWHYTYDSYGDQTSVTDPLGNKTTYTYNALGEKTSMVSPRGNVSGATPANFTTSYTYDAYKNETQTTDPLGHSTSQTFDALVGKLTSTDARSNQTTYAYNADHELVTTTEPTTNTVTNTYDAVGNKSSTTDERNKTTTFGYDALNRLTSTTDPNSHTTSETYDQNGNKVTQTDPNGNQTTYAYNAANQLASETEAYGTSSAITSTYTYDANGNKTSSTNGASQTTAYVYDSLNELTSTTDPLSKTTSFTYDADRNQVTLTNSDSKITTTTYNGDNKVTGIAYSDGVTHGVTYTYDPDSNVATITDASGTSTYSYDDADRLTSLGNGASATVSYGYNAANDVTSIGYAVGKTVTQTYDSMNRLSSIEDWLSNTTNLSYDNAGNQSTMSYPNGVTETRTYDNASQLSSISDTSGSTTLASFSSTRDNNGQVTGETDTGVPAGPSSYSYNGRDELTAAGSSAYGYDSAQDLTTAPSGNSQAFNADDEVCWSGAGSGSCSSPPSGATTYSYSNEGNRSATTPSTGISDAYTWSEANLLTGVTPSTGLPTSYAYDGNNLLQSETTGSNTTEFTWDTQSSVPLLLSDGTNYYIYGAGNSPIEQISVSTGSPSYLLSDQIASIRDITSSAGSVVGSTTYGPWGSVTGTSGSATSPFGFAGQYLDPVSDFYYLRARWYDPGTGEFLSVDPMVIQTTQPYSYAGNDPVNASDPTGEYEHNLGVFTWQQSYWVGLLIAFDISPLADFIPFVGPFFSGLAAWVGAKYLSCGELGAWTQTAPRQWSVRYCMGREYTIPFFWWDSHVPYWFDVVALNVNFQPLTSF
jgi:RHS repeat-associated protein